MQKVPVETIGSNDAKIGMQALFNDKRKMQEQAEKEGAEIIEIPLPDNPGATRHAGIPAEAVGAMAKALADQADGLRQQNPTLNDDMIRTLITTNGGLSIAKFMKMYPGIFYTFTARETQGETRGRMLQVIMLKMQLEKGNISREDSHGLLADLFGVNEQQRADLRSNLEKIAESQKKN